MDAIEQYKHAEQMEWKGRTMTHWLQHVEDDTGDLVDVLHFCGRECATSAESAAESEQRGAIELAKLTV